MRILYFYPENPLLLNQGNNSRANALLQYFKSHSIEVDFVGVESEFFTPDSIKQLEDNCLIRNGYLLKEFRLRENRIKYFFRYSIPNKIFNRAKHFSRVRFQHQSYFNNILKSNKYDYIIISYAYWAELVIGNSYTKNAKLCIDTHDFLTSQFQNLNGFKLGKYFQKEIELLKKFDRIWVISIEEKYLFSQFIKTPIDLITHSLPNNTATSILADKTIDIIYVGSDNEHNIKSAKWFFEEVYPQLSDRIKITVVGKINHHISEYDNVEKLLFVKDLDDVYKKSKIAICPMLSGTGLKIKVVESLAYGLPVVCTEKGVDGLLNKTNNGCLTTNDPLLFFDYIHKLLEEEEFYQKIHLDAKAFFESNFDIQKTYKVLDDIFE